MTAPVPPVATPTENPELLERIENTIRFLAVDAIERAGIGHVGAPMALAAPAFELWDRHLRFDPRDPAWPLRDRFVLSNGHASMLQYALLHLFGFDVTIEDIADFRQLGSRTPGHPEYGETAGVELTTGPLGQGFAHGVGMALAARMTGSQLGGGPGRDDRDRPGQAFRIRLRRRRGPDGGCGLRGGLLRGPSRPRQPHLPLRRQPDHDRWRDRDHLWRERAAPLRGLRLARRRLDRRPGSGRAAARPGGRARGDGPPLADRAEDVDRSRVARSGGQEQGPWWPPGRRGDEGFQGIHGLASRARALRARRGA